MKPDTRGTIDARFFKRELSWLDFNHRWLEEAQREENRLLERARFAAIVASNLDEFFMVRVAQLKHLIQTGERRPGPCGLTPADQFDAVAVRAQRMVAELYRTTFDDLLPALAREGLVLLRPGALDDTQRAAAMAYVHDHVLPALTPLAIDVERPFPMLASLALNLAFWLAPTAEDEAPRLAVVQVPGRLSRLVRVADAGRTIVVLLEDLIRLTGDSLFPGQTLIESAAFRLSRDSELEPEDEGGSYVEALREELRRRRRNTVVRLEVEQSASADLVAMLMDQVHVGPADVYRVAGPLDPRFLMAFLELPGAGALLDPPHQPAAALGTQELDDLFSVLDARDVLLHHPYESFDPVVRFVEEAAEDPDVLAIKQTLYRTSGNSPIVRALIRAADLGKQVTVIVELRARFDEERNIQWAGQLEAMGAHVIYGLRHYKVHAKACLVVKRTPTGVRRYLHLGTGNYNDRTARLYTDFGLLTSSAALGADASAFFSMLTGYSDPPRFQKLAAAPATLRTRLVKLIEREVARAREGQPAEIRAKMNSLTDGAIIETLYAASQAGVRVQLNVRGICALRPGVPGLSDRVSVVSVVGRFLEHSRIVVFHNGGDEEVYLSSADWMTRNLDHRVELLFPIEDRESAARVSEALDLLLRDGARGRVLGADGIWRSAGPAAGLPALDAQTLLDDLAHRRAGQRADELHPLRHTDA